MIRSLLALVTLIFMPMSPALAEDPTMPATLVASGVLTDPGVSQSLAYDPVNQVWVMVQQRASYPAGDLTFTALAKNGRILNHMYATGFGHGLSISVERVNGTLYVWSETMARQEPAHPGSNPGMYGYRIARFSWHPGATITPTSPYVTLYGGNQAEETPSLDIPHNQLGLHYWSPSANSFRFVVYDLAKFRLGQYVVLASFNDPVSTQVNQGWVLDGDQIWRLDQDTQVTISQIDFTGTIISSWPVPAALDIPDWEAEGITMTPAGICVNIAGGPPGSFHTINLLCQGAL